MRLSEVSKEFSLKTGIKTVWQIMLVMLVMSNALLAFKLVTTTSTHRETLVPPTINKTFWVDGEKVSPGGFKLEVQHLPPIKVRRCRHLVRLTSSFNLKIASPLPA